MAQNPFGPFDPRNPLFGGPNPYTMSSLGANVAPAAAPTPAADAARATAHAAMPIPGYPGAVSGRPGPPRPGAGAAPAFGLGGSMGMGGGASGYGDPAMEQIMQMRQGSPSVTTSAPQPQPARRPQAPRAPAPGGDTGPAAGVPEPASPEGQVGPTLTAPPPAVPAAAMAADDPDKADFLDMQNAIVDWQMGMGGQGQRMTDANRLQESGMDINTRAARVKGNNAVNQLTRALGGIGQGYAAYKAGGERADIKKTTDMLRDKSRAELERIREKRRGGKKPTTAVPASASDIDRAFAQSGDVSALLDDDEDKFVIG